MIVPEVASTVDLAQIGISGLALGSLYGLIAVGFVVVYKATKVINLAHGGSALLGAYLTYWLHMQVGLPYVLAAVGAMAMCAVLGMLVQRFLVEPVLNRDMHASLMVTMGVLIVMQAVVFTIWGTDLLDAGDPWGLKTLKVGSLSITARDLSVIVVAALAVVAFFLFFKFTLMGTAMRATAFHREASAAQGISPRLIGMVSWGIAGALGGLAGLLLSTTAGGGVQPTISSSALVALSAIIVGGLDSPGGAVLGGIIIGLAQQYAASYSPDVLGTGVSAVLPYVVMVLILIVRPTGLRGTADIRRI
jgi:branched-chain amino acid transport system permease protein